MKLGAWIAISVCGALGLAWLVMSLYAMIQVFGHLWTWMLIIQMFGWAMLARQEIFRSAP